jgi:tartrate dehydratase beta subunit/fumarate hydratase class I family protein
MTGISCPSSAFCVAVDQVGNVATSSNPIGGAAAWAVTHVDGKNCTVTATSAPPCALTAVSCPTTTFCVATDSHGNVVVSSNPTGGAAAWMLGHVDSNYLASISCPSNALCVAVDIVGNVVTSTNPAGGAAAWKATHVDGSNCIVSETGAPCFLSSVSCPSLDFCVAVDESGNVVTSTRPTGGAAAWKVTNLNNGGLYDPYSLHSGVSCPTSRLCFGVGNDSEARAFQISSTDPTGGTTAWTRTIHIGGSILNSVSCPSSNLCVAVSYWGDVVTSTTPGAPPAA